MAELYVNFVEMYTVPYTFMLLWYTTKFNTVPKYFQKRISGIPRYFPNYVKNNSQLLRCHS